jgi:aspartyl protease family protein
VVGWALRWVLLCCGIAILADGIVNRFAALPPHQSTPSAADAQPAAAANSASAPAFNTIVFAANRQGHVVLQAAINAPVRLLVDTGASLVTLTPEDARAAGIEPRTLAFSGRVNTANGPTRMAPVRLREVRIQQLSLYDVPAAVLEHLDISLLGMSFLGRLESYEMRDGKLTINW